VRIEKVRGGYQEERTFPRRETPEGRRDNRASCRHPLPISGTNSRSAIRAETIYLEDIPRQMFFKPECAVTRLPTFRTRPSR